MDPERSRAGRAAAELALVRVVHHYGTKPEFVVLGGLVPELLWTHSVMVQADESERTAALVECKGDLARENGTIGELRANTEQGSVFVGSPRRRARARALA